MAGTDRSQNIGLGGPVVVLVRPQLGENIGTAARAMLNFGLVDLRLVRPRCGWPNEKAIAASSRAVEVLNQVQVFETTEEAIADLGFVIAATARPRDMAKPELTPRVAACRCREIEGAGSVAGMLFGREAAGLDNDDVALADAILSIPANPAFASLNIAQAVLLAAYEWYVSGDEVGVGQASRQHPVPATREEVVAFFEHLEAELDSGGFLKPPEKRPRMVRNLRNLFHRAGLSAQEVRTLRGVVTSLSGRHKI